MAFLEEIKEIKGIGDDTAKKIADKFSNWSEIRNSSLSEVTEIEGIGQKTAELVFDKADSVEESSIEKGIIMNYKGGRKSQVNNELIIKVDAEYPSQLIGRKVKWETPGNRFIKGKIIQEHGKRGKLLTRFEKGLPGQALGTKAIIE